MIGPSGQLAVSAITQVNRVDAVYDAAGTNVNTAGGFYVEVEQGFTSQFPGTTAAPELLQVMRAYWTYMVGDATITP